MGNDFGDNERLWSRGNNIGAAAAIAEIKSNFEAGASASTSDKGSDFGVVI
jgi:hypothetical protein